MVIVQDSSEKDEQEDHVFLDEKSSEKEQNDEERMKKEGDVIDSNLARQVTLVKLESVESEDDSSNDDEVNFFYFLFRICENLCPFWMKLLRD